MASGYFDWDGVTALNNGSSDALINWLENQAPSTVNNSARAMMLRFKQFLNDQSAQNTVGGTANALTLTPVNVLTAYGNGQFYTIKPIATNTGSATINVSALGTKALRKISGATDVALVQGDLLNGGLYTIYYSTAANAAAGGFVVMNPSNFEVGGQITFPATANPSTGANVLDDYRELTATPTVTAGSGSFTSVSSVVTSTKIGNAVICSVSVVDTTNGTAAAFASVPLSFSPSVVGSFPGQNSSTALGLSTRTSGSNLLIFKYDGTFPLASGQTINLSGAFHA